MAIAPTQLIDFCKTQRQRDVLKAVIEAKGSFKGASEKLNVNRSSVSKLMKRLRSYRNQCSDVVASLPKPEQAKVEAPGIQKLKRFSFVTDSHGDMCDWSIWRRYREFDSNWNPHVRIHGGDAMDLRSYRKGASQEEQLDRIADDMVSFFRFFEEYKPDVWLQGNHDARLWEGAEMTTNADRSELCRHYIEKIDKFLPKIDCKVTLPYQVRKGIYQMGSLKFAHGYKTGVNCARQMAMSYGSIIFGHTHTYQRVVIPHLEDIIAISSPVVCRTDMSYLDRCVGALQHRQGWTYGAVNERTGKWEAWSAVFDELGNWIDPFSIIRNLH